ncbi:fasciclin domain-containing protein [Flavobacterium magnesitis]|uniref:fasciclin domain-containing protein n=1 Tax=Flavobacterium magnesitis TaxID=3138077 RepID=UPI00358FCDC4
MNILKFKYKRLFASVLTLAMVSCSNPWDDRTDNGDANLTVTLSEAITNTTEVSQFAQLLVETGYDKILADSKTYTVFVPTNAAMAAVGNDILDNPETLKKFVENHIALTAYSSERSDEETQIKMYSSKFLIFKGNNTIDDASIVNPDNYAKNGVFHIINKALAPKLNIWQYINSVAETNQAATYLQSLKGFSIYKSDSLAKIVSEENGAGYLADSLTNSYLRNVYNLNNENNLYTLFLMEDAGYTAEVDKMKPYLIKKTNTERDSTAIYAQYFTLRDMAFHGKYELDELPANLVSRFGVVVPVDKTQIVETIHLSNGIVYIMKRVEVELDKRLLTKQIEGEDNDGFFNFVRSRMFYRDREDLSGLSFQDVMVQNTGAVQPWLSYSGKDFYSTKYQVKWRAVNDIQTNVFQQRVIIYGKSEVIDGATTFTEQLAIFPYTNVERNFYEEVLIGEFTLDEARDIDFISLVGANTTANGTNSITLDYLKFIPVIK